MRGNRFDVAAFRLTRRCSWLYAPVGCLGRRAFHLRWVMQFNLLPDHCALVISALRHWGLGSAFNRHYRWLCVYFLGPSGACFVAPSLLWVNSALADLDATDSLCTPSARADAGQPVLFIKTRSVARAYFQCCWRGFKTPSVMQIKICLLLPSVLIAAAKALQRVLTKVCDERRAEKKAFGWRSIVLRFWPLRSLLAAVSQAGFSNQGVGLTWRLCPEGVLRVVLSRGLRWRCVITWLGHMWVLDTTTRIAPVFARWVLHHLLRLLCHCLAHRPMGGWVARVERVEIICAFITATAFLLWRDVPFLVQFLAAMCFDRAQRLRIAVALLAGYALRSFLHTFDCHGMALQRMWGSQSKRQFTVVLLLALQRTPESRGIANRAVITTQRCVVEETK